MQIAQAAGVHPNTVRLYERIGLLAPITRTAGGYRSFSERDRAQMRVARLAIGGPYVVPKALAAEAARHAALDDLETALEFAERFKALVAGRLRVIRMLLCARYSAMSILRMVTHLDRGGRDVLSTVIDTPRDDETVYSATDRWLSSLREAGVRAEQLRRALRELIQHRE